MTWSADEWEGFALCLEEWWKDEMTDANRLAWKLAIDDIEPVVAVAALKQLLRRGKTWRPSVAEFVTALEPVVMSFDEAWSVIEYALNRAPWSYENGPVLDDVWVLAYVGEHAGPIVAGWVSSYGVPRLCREETGDPGFGGAVLKRLRDSYIEATSTPSGRDRLVAALNAPARRGELRRMSPLVALPEPAA